MAVQFNPYFTFSGQTRDAMAFYQDVFGGELQVASFADFQAPVPDEHKDLVMHAELITTHGFNLRASDGGALRPATQASTNMEASLIGAPADLETGKEWFTKLEEGATNVQPLTEAPWGATFGSLTDRFGIAWMFNYGG
ncbi:MAG: VOC family protein [Rothia sp. (in: high G+C Gram-positive bacteria)]|nr:VOC family protein [Rothia sp. (in: high G+C Gram-positive bacteria)]